MNQMGRVFPMFRACGAGAPFVRRDEILLAIPLAGLVQPRCPECGRRFAAADASLDHHAKTQAAASVHVFTLAIITAATGRNTITGSHSGRAGSRNPGRFTLWQMNVNT